jgi:hypothetical protein
LPSIFATIAFLLIGCPPAPARDKICFPLGGGVIYCID